MSIGHKGAVILAGLLALAAQPARAEDEGFGGRWRETGLAGSARDGCLRVVRHGTVLTIVSADGWSAVATTDRYVYARVAVGVGQWQADAGRRDGRFDVLIAVSGERLLVVKSEDTGRGQVSIKRLYERQLPPSYDHI